MFRFRFLDKSALQETLPALFRILYDNMNAIAPTGGSYEEDEALWSAYITDAMQEDSHRIVLFYVDEEFAGYFQYSVDEEPGAFLMEEIEIKPEFQGTGIFSALYRWLMPQLPAELQTVHAYANKQNKKSQSILEHLGLSCVSENKSGSSLYYQGAFAPLRAKYSL